MFEEHNGLYLAETHSAYGHSAVGLLLQDSFPQNGQWYNGEIFLDFPYLASKMLYKTLYKKTKRPHTYTKK